MRAFLCLFSARQLPRGLFALLCTALAGLGSAEAATLTVTTTADGGAGSLRAAIASSSDGDTIQFDPALNGQTINLTSGELPINKNLTIDGPGPSQLAVSGSNSSRSRTCGMVAQQVPGLSRRSLEQVSWASQGAAI